MCCSKCTSGNISRTLRHTLGYSPRSKTDQLPARHNSVGLHSIATNHLMMTSLQLTLLLSDYTLVETNSYLKLHAEQASLKTIGSSVGQKIPRILWNPNFQYRINNSPILTFIMIHIHPVQSVTRRFIPFRLYLLLFSYLHWGYPSGYFPSGISNKTLYEFIYPHTCYMPPAIAVCLFSLPINIWRGKPVLKLILFSPASC
jgi:hypothetical protein